MEEENPLQTSTFWYEESNLKMFCSYPMRIEGGFILLCTKGEAIISTGIKQFNIVKNSGTMFLSGTTFFLLSSSEDFNARMFTFSKELYCEIVLNLTPSFAMFMNKMPIYEHPVDSSTLKNVRVFMDMAALVFEERKSLCSHILQRNFLHNYMLYVLENIQPFLSQVASKYTRRQKLFQRFSSLVQTHCMQHHNITFYAEQLCITPRYLYLITFECSPRLSPKQVIDMQLMLEIKALLYSSDFTLSEIAHQLNLPDQSYLCRYFKRHTGISPTEYRN